MLRSWHRRLRLRLHLKKKMSFEDVRNTLLIAYADVFLDDEEFSILYDYYQPVNPPISRLEFWSILFGCVRLLRVRSSLQGGQGWYSDVIERIADSGEFQVPTGNSLQWLRRTSFTAKTISIPMPLFRFNFNFWTSVPELYMMANTVLDWVFNEHWFRLTSWSQPFLTPTCLQEYARAITRQGSPLTNCFGFTDGTVRPIWRSGEKQRIVYNRHERVHSQII